MKKSSTLKFIMNISFLPSVCIHRSIILIFIEKKSMLVPWKIFCSAIFDFYFGENPRFRDEFQALILTLGQRVPVLTLKCQAPGRVATGAPNFMSLVGLDPEKSRHKWESNPGSATLKVDALTTRPTSQSLSLRNTKHNAGLLSNQDTI